MFTKLLKHEFQSCKKSIGVISIATLLAAVLGYVMMLIAISNLEIRINNVLSSLSVLLQGSIFLMLAVYLIGGNIYLYIRFYKTKFTDEGYLTFTLPASTHQILLSSILNIIIWQFIITLVFIISIFIIIAPLLVKFQNDFNIIGNLIKNSRLITVTPNIIFSSIMEMLSAFCYSIILPLFSITVGSLHAKKHKLLASFGFGYVINMAFSFITSIISIIELAGNNSASEGIYNIIPTVIISFITITLSVFGYFIMHQMIEDKLNI